MSRHPHDAKVYVGELGNNASKQDIEEAFGYYGPLRNVWVARNPPGFAFVEFEDARDAEDAATKRSSKNPISQPQRTQLDEAIERDSERERGKEVIVHRNFASAPFSSTRNINNCCNFRRRITHPPYAPYQRDGERGLRSRSPRSRSRELRTRSRSYSRSRSRDRRSRSKGTPKRSTQAARSVSRDVSKSPRRSSRSPASRSRSRSAKRSVSRSPSRSVLIDDVHLGELNV
ncbi:hypothetical protein ZHAS_00010597 [Anopheles sinensis]|uniref:RRM domain-containing protein n=1 Tax=Anopheles sinensis TaxID=74873 RepID=A0A084VXY6_ANOSI|nr:hypothetical protein ZHAS_00010597 [Anopheles sinensis]